MAGRLTKHQVEFYEREGYLLFDQSLFGQAKFDALQAHFEHLLERWTKTLGRRPESMDVPHFSDARLFDWLFDEAVLEVVESVIGLDIALWSSHFICKPPAVGQRVPWHEDSAYWKGVLDPMQVVTVWLAVDPSTPDNGCMRVIPGTHHHGDSQYAPVADASQAVFSTEIEQDQFDESEAVDLILEPNHCSLHDGKLVHGSNANQGRMRRCGYTMRYMPTTVKYCKEALKTHSEFQIYLARGKDRAGNRYGDPGKPNEAYLAVHPEFRQLTDVSG